jgi:hypothetical protein
VHFEADGFASHGNLLFMPQHIGIDSCKTSVTSRYKWFDIHETN